MEYIIKYWETETDRNRGESNIYLPNNKTDLSDVKNQATRLYNRDGLACVEVVIYAGTDDEKCLLHLSN
tara:strand:- start:1733 stop:1939 length:207 start_codon:yes stop_codon:yes gene_type:complete